MKTRRNGNITGILWSLAGFVSRYSQVQILGHAREIAKWFGHAREIANWFAFNQLGVLTLLCLI